MNTQDNDNAIYSDFVSLDVATTFNEIQTQLKEITFSINSHQKLIEQKDRSDRANNLIIADLPEGTENEDTCTCL